MDRPDGRARAWRRQAHEAPASNGLHRRAGRPGPAVRRSRRLRMTKRPDPSGPERGRARVSRRTARRTQPAVASEIGTEARSEASRARTVAQRRDRRSTFGPATRSPGADFPTRSTQAGELGRRHLRRELAEDRWQRASSAPVLRGLAPPAPYPPRSPVQSRRVTRPHGPAATPPPCPSGRRCLRPELPSRLAGTADTPGGGGHQGPHHETATRTTGGSRTPCRPASVLAENERTEQVSPTWRLLGGHEPLPSARRAGSYEQPGIAERPSHDSDLDRRGIRRPSSRYWVSPTIRRGTEERRAGSGADRG